MNHNYISILFLTLSLKTQITIKTYMMDLYINLLKTNNSSNASWQATDGHVVVPHSILTMNVKDITHRYGSFMTPNIFFIIFSYCSNIVSIMLGQLLLRHNSWFLAYFVFNYYNLEICIKRMPGPSIDKHAISFQRLILRLVKRKIKLREIWKLCLWCVWNTQFGI